MPSVTKLLTAFRQELITDALVRKPSDAGALHPMFIEPKDGAPAPGEKTGAEGDVALMLSIGSGGDIPNDAMLAFVRKTTIDVFLRAATNQSELAYDLEAKIQAAVVDKWAWQMGGLFILESRLWSGMTKIDSSAAQGATFKASYYFEMYRD